MGAVAFAHTSVMEKAQRGVTALAIVSVITRVAALGLHVALASVLDASQFGAYALAMGAFALIQATRDAGLRHLLAQRHVGQNRRLATTAFHVALLYNTVLGGVVLAAVLVARWAYGTDHIANALVILALVPLGGTIGSIAQARLRSELRFALLARIEAVATLLRVGMTFWLVLAWSGSGYLGFAFAVPMLLYVLLPTFLAPIYLAQEQIWRGTVRLRLWRPILRRSSWLVLQGVAASTISAGIYPILGLVVRQDELGTYFFALQLVGQIGLVYSMSVEMVLLPVLVSARRSFERYAYLVQNALRISLAVLIPVGLLFVVAFPLAEDLLWSGKWRHAGGTVTVLGVLYPFVVTHLLGKTILLERGAFRAAAMWLTGLAVAQVLGGVGGALLLGGAVGVAFGSSFVAAIGSIVVLTQAAPRQALVWDYVGSVSKWLPAGLVAGLSTVVVALIGLPWLALVGCALLVASTWLTFRFSYPAVYRRAASMRPRRA